MQKDAEEATTPTGHKYEDPPEAVRGQLLRLQMTDSPGRNKVRRRVDLILRLYHLKCLILPALT